MHLATHYCEIGTHVEEEVLLQGCNIRSIGHDNALIPNQPCLLSVIELCFLLFHFNVIFQPLDIYNIATTSAVITANISRLFIRLHLQSLLQSSTLEPCRPLGRPSHHHPTSPLWPICGLRTNSEKIVNRRFHTTMRLTSVYLYGEVSLDSKHVK